MVREGGWAGGQISMSTKIVIANRIHGPELARLRAVGEVMMNPDDQPWTREALLAHCRDANAVMVFMTETIDAAFLDACPSVRIIAGALKGYNNIDVAACSARGIVVTIVPDLLTDPTAELAIGLMIAAARNIGPGDRDIRDGSFQGWRPKYYGGSVQGACVGVLGAGAVGQAIMRMLAGFSCDLKYMDKRPLPAAQDVVLNARAADLDDILATADFIVLALHLMPSTQHLVDDGFLARMKPGSYLINPARGSLVDEAAVARALARGHLAGYAADTFEMEDWTRADRPRRIHPDLLASENTVLTPHIGSAVGRVRQAIERSAADSIIAVCGGAVPDTAVNAEDLHQEA